MSIFGESIETIMSRGGEDKIPTFLRDVLTYLNTKGDLEFKQIKIYFLIFILQSRS